MFPIFPIFRHLDLEDKDAYNKIIAKYPPYSDILFPTLQIWWNLDNKLLLSSLNKNLVINYHLPFDPENSGYSIIGNSDVDNSIKTIFKHLRHSDKPAKLVHVPEFTVESIKDKRNLDIKDERDYHEYIILSSALADLDGPNYAKARRSIRLFFREVHGKKLEVKNLDLSSAETGPKLMHSLEELVKKHPARNDLEHTENRAMEKTLLYYSVLGISNLCVYVDDRLSGFILYHKPPGHKYYVVHHLKVNYDIPYIFDYMEHQLAVTAVKNNIEYINCEMDLGIDGLRRHKTHLMPINFFRKYMIFPK